MSLFRKKEFRKKEMKMPECACGNNDPAWGTGTVQGEPAKECCQKTAGKTGCIKVLGSGCKSCRALLQSAETAVKSMGLDLEVEYITDVRRIAEYGIISTPALVVNEQVVSAGKVLSAEKAEQLLRNYLTAAAVK